MQITHHFEHSTIPAIYFFNSTCLAFNTIRQSRYTSLYKNISTQPYSHAWPLSSFLTLFPFINLKQDISFKFIPKAQQTTYNSTHLITAHTQSLKIYLKQTEVNNQKPNIPIKNKIIITCINKEGRTHQPQ